MRLLAAFFLLLSAHSTAAQSGSAAGSTLPPFTLGYEPTTVDERGLWMDADEYERRMRNSALTVRDEALHGYLQKVLCRTVGAERCRGVRLYIQEVPAFNASMAPNGTMAVWSGLLLRARNEAELAAVLAHEFAHFELRHGVQGFKQRRKATNVSAWLAVLGGLANSNTSSAQALMIGTMFQFSREQEQAADILGFKYLEAANYPTVAASQIWQHVMAEHDATAIGNGLKPKQRYSAGFFDTHPTPLNRADYLAAEARKIGDSGRSDGANDLRAAIANHLPRWLQAQIKLNDFGGTEYLLQQLATNGGWTGNLLFARGELYRSRGNPRDLATSVHFYRDALAAGYVEPQVHRNLGMSLLRSGQTTAGQASLAEYLRLLPEASDAKAVQALIGK